MIQAALAVFTAMGWAGRIAAIVVPLLALGTAYGVWHHKVYTKGYNAAIAGIAAADERAVGRAKAARGKLLDCRAQGKGWDQTTGSCL